ncbi:MAG TPA: allantoicase [Gemmatimonadaceae bacterium]|nr:allantoicase [Gemmatimonadaceae bacterium]
MSFTDLIDLASERLGASVIAANDEFFAPKESLVKPGVPEWREGVYTERGKWMDGWETRRRRTSERDWEVIRRERDWAIVRLGVPGVVHGVVIDTTHFTGNYPERASIDALAAEGVPSIEWLTGGQAQWEPLLPETELAGNRANELTVESRKRVTHVRLNIFPDGGVARLRVHGTAAPDPGVFTPSEVDLAAMENGGFVVECSDMHYGHRQNLILPGRSTHMGDGWETKRRRGPGHEWTIVRLAHRGKIHRVEIDTDHFRGNSPAALMLEGCDAEVSESFSPDTVTWREIVTDSPVQPHSRHQFHPRGTTPVTHVRLNIYPDGGIARLRVIGRPSS